MKMKYLSNVPPERYIFYIGKKRYNLSKWFGYPSQDRYESYDEEDFRSNRKRDPISSDQRAANERFKKRLEELGLTEEDVNV